MNVPNELFDDLVDLAKCYAKHMMDDFRAGEDDEWYAHIQSVLSRALAVTK